MAPGRIARQDYEYKRCGTRNLFVFVEPQAGRRHVLVTRRRTKLDFAYAMRYLVDRLYLDAEYNEVVLDNLNTHTAETLIEIFGNAEANRILSHLRFHYTPTHASWLNMAEIEIGVLGGQCLNRRIASEFDLYREVIEQKAKIVRSFTREKAQEKFVKNKSKQLCQGTRMKARIIMADCMTTNKVRREIRSAIQPPNRENTRVGTPAMKPTKPR